MHNKLEIDITRHSDEEGKRYYAVSPESLWHFFAVRSVTRIRYPSVTTILDKVSDKEGLRAWQNRVGYAKAEAIKAAAARRGTAIHSYIECYYKKKKLPALKAEELSYITQVMPLLVRSFPLFIEQPIFWANSENPRIGYAGTLDICLQLKVGDEVKNVIADFKTWSKPKNPQYLYSYCFQLAAYAGALNYLTKGLYKINEALIIGLTPSGSHLYYLNKDAMRAYWDTWEEILYSYFNDKYFPWKDRVQELPKPEIFKED